MGDRKPTNGQVLRKYRESNICSLCLLACKWSVEFEALQETFEEYAVQPLPEFRNFLYDIFTSSLSKDETYCLPLVNLQPVSESNKDGRTEGHVHTNNTVRLRKELLIVQTLADIQKEWTN